MIRQTILFAFVALLLNAFFLIQVQYESRQLNAQLHLAQIEGGTLKEGREHLLIERRRLETPQKIEMRARKSLGMYPGTPASTYYLHQLDGSGPGLREL